MGQHPDLRKGGQALLSCLCPQSELWPMVSPEMLSLTVCNNSLTLSTTWPPVSDGRQSVHQGLRGFTSLLELKAAREQSQNCLTERPPSSHRLTAEWLLAPSGTLSTTAPFFREALRTHISGACQQGQTPPGGTKSAGWTWEACKRNCLWLPTVT